MERIMSERLDIDPSNPITEEMALDILNEVKTVKEFLDLASLAARIRDREVGTTFKFDGFIGPITPCTTNPPCRYCSRSAKGRPDSFSRPLTLEEIRSASEFIARTGTKRVEIGGGTPWNGAGKKVMEAVEVVKEYSSMDIYVNVGPALKREDLAELKSLGVKEVGSNLEAINPDVFRDAKPGDSLEARMELAEEINDIGLGLSSVIMVGIGSSYEDYVRHIFWLRKFKNLSRVAITGLRPIPGTPFQDRPMANPLEVAKIGAMARLILRDVDIGFGGMMGDPRLLVLWVMAGANRSTHHFGAGVYKASSLFMQYPNILIERHGDLEFINMLPLTTRYVKEMGMDVDVE
jgi:biotin synthase